MKIKRLLKLSAIIIGALMYFSFNKVQAIDSAFDGTNITRDNLQIVATSNMLATSNTSTTLGISKTRKTGNYYSWESNTTVDAKNVWKIADYSSGNVNYSDLYYCLNAERGFGSTQGRMAEGATDEYTTEYEVNDTNKNNIISIAGGSLGTNYNKVLWILDNLYIPTGSSSYKTSTDYKNFKTKTGLNYDLTEEQIEVVQQMAIWYYTNNSYEDPSNNRGNLPNLYYNGNQTSSIVLTVDDYGEIITLYDELNNLYRYFINGANSNSNYTHKIPTLTLSNAQATVTENENYFIAGPFSLNGTNTDLISEITANVTPNKSYTLLNSNGNTVSGNNFKNVIGSNFYLRFNKSDITSDTTFNIKLEYKYNIRNLIVKTSTSPNTTQPVVLIEDGTDKDLTSTEITIDLPEIPDLALRKYITKLGNTNITNRVPTISNTDKLDNNDATNHTAVYKHPKNALEVEKGKTIEYSLTIYNEGKVAARASKITDQIPAGLKLIEIVSGNYEVESYNEDTNILVLKEKSVNSDLGIYEKGKELKNTTVVVKCEVLDSAEENVNLVNIAWISEMKKANETFTADIDSQTTSNPSCNKNSHDYTRPNENGFYPGNQDDDDYERVIIRTQENPVSPDLALRKFITKIENKEYDREPQIGSWTLDDGTTVIKSHSKDALTVETGNIVTYKIRIYNEGNVSGKATKVTDYLPSGLKLVENNSINNTYGWTKGITSNGYTAITTDYLKDTEIEAYSGRGIPKFEDLEIVCEVTAEAGETTKNLKNIAEITTAEYEKGTTDIDSQPGNVHATSSYSPTHPTTGRGEQDDDDFELLKLEPRRPELDLALRKFITKINDTAVNREPVVNTSTINTVGTARYVHSKDPISVQVGDIVTYKIRVYNEGEIDGYVAKITDHLPEWLDFIPEDTINQKYLWNIDDNRTISTEIAAKDSVTGEEIYSQRPSKQLLKAYNGGNSLDFIDFEIRCRVNDNAPNGRLLTNIAEISKMQNEQGTEIITDRDSTKANVNLPSDEELPDYTRPEDNGYFPGQEDDDDFEKVIVKKFDLALRKFITKIGDTEYNREPAVDTSKLGTLNENGDEITTATYNHSKDPLNVKKGDIITYTLRVYNEGSIAGYATEVFDYIPEGLEFIDKNESSINQTYGWESRDGKIVTTYLADKLINGVTESNADKILDYKDVQVQLKVTADPKQYAGSIITNYAEIGEDSNNDIDSTPGNGHGDMNSKEDDDDFEPVKLGYFDLALRKFITKVNEIDYNNRVPEVDTSKIGTLDENGKKITTFTYNHTKDPVVVETGSTVIYTIRVYNEGSISGYAYEITDNIPEGLEFLPDNETNSEYKWKMLDEQGNITEDITKAKKIITGYLAEDIIDGYKKENGVEQLSYKDVKVAFKVIEKNTSDRLVINIAEISKASDEDIDSTPGNNDLTEDDIDREYLKVKYFDLALKKWVTATRVIYNGKTTETKTGFNEDSTEMTKVDIVSKRLNKTTVKFVYKIKVINEGEVAGYATEVEDYIPSGLKFVAEDNPKWKLIKDDVAVTDELKDTLLEPGQSATVEIVLTWKNTASNMGVKTNWAEIKDDSGDDVDSVPDNYKKEEDDIDNAKVILSIKTGTAKTYIILGLISITILAGGTFAIKKYVINN